MTSQTCNRIDLAREQLESALVLFLEHRSFASAITLSGAAERVLGQALRHRAEQAVLDCEFDLLALVHMQLHGQPLTKQNFAQTENRVFNALRHFDSADEPHFVADLEEAACWMLVRACENSNRLGLTVQGFDTFNDWFHENIVGI